MKHGQLAAHESMEVHELLNFKTISLAKSKLMQGIVFDQDLRALLQKDVGQSTNAITELVGIYQRAPIE